LSQRWNEALADFDRALGLDPNHASAWLNKALALFSRGDLREGVRYLEWRGQVLDRASAARPYSPPAWSGPTALAGKTILLNQEQGYGDSIQFCRYATMAAQSGAHVILQVPPPLVALMQTLRGVSRVVADGDPEPDHDLHCSLMSLPAGF